MRRLSAHSNQGSAGPRTGLHGQQQQPRNEDASARTKVFSKFQSAGPFEEPSDVRVPSCYSTHPERAYLASALQRQGDRAMGIYKSLTQAEARLGGVSHAGLHSPGRAPAADGDGGGSNGDEKGRRRLRKEVSLLKSKLSQAEQQERLILLRLGDLYMETQRQERRAQLQPHFATTATNRRRPGHPGGQAPEVMPPLLPMVYSQPFWSEDGLPTPITEMRLWRGELSPGGCYGSQTEKPSQRPAISVSTASPKKTSVLSPLSPVFEPGASTFPDNFLWSRNGEFERSSGPQREGSKADSSDQSVRLGLEDRMRLPHYKYGHVGVAHSEGEGEGEESSEACSSSEDDTEGQAWGDCPARWRYIVPHPSKRRQNRHVARSVSMSSAVPSRNAGWQERRASLPSLQSA